jgi:hypothetical protein
MKLFPRIAGQAMVETSLVFLILVFLIFGGISVLQTLTVQFTVNQAVRTAAHEAALQGSTGGLEYGRVYVLAQAPGSIADAARNVMSGGVFTTDLTKARITAACAVNPCRRYSAITIRVQFDDDAIAPIPMYTRVSADRTATRASEKDQQP